MEKELLQIFKQHVTYLNQLEEKLPKTSPMEDIRNYKWYDELSKADAKIAYNSNLKLVEMNQFLETQGENKSLFLYSEIDSSKRIDDINSLETNTRIVLNPVYERIIHPLKDQAIYNETYNLLKSISSENKEQFINIIQNSLLDDLFSGDVAQIQSRIQEILYENELNIALNTPNDYLFIKAYNNDILNITDSISYLNENYRNNPNIISNDDLNSLISYMERLNSLEQLDTTKSLKQYQLTQNIENGSLKRSIQDRMKDATQNVKDNEIISKNKDLEKPLNDSIER